MVNNSSQSGSVHAVIIIVLIAILIGSFGFISWKNVSVKNSDSGLVANTYSKEDWIAYKDGELPFIFDYPKDLRVSKEEAKRFFLLDSTGEKIISIEYVKMPYGLSRGVSACQIRRSNANDSCSYIDNGLIGYFYGLSKDEVWRGTLEYPDADIILTLISKDQQSKSILVGVAESIRSKS